MKQGPQLWPQQCRLSGWRHIWAVWQTGRAAGQKSAGGWAAEWGTLSAWGRRSLAPHQSLQAYWGREEDSEEEGVISLTPMAEPQLPPPGCHFGVLRFGSNTVSWGEDCKGCFFDSSGRHWALLGDPFITAGHGKGGEPSSSAHAPSLNGTGASECPESGDGRALRQ